MSNGDPEGESSAFGLADGSIAGAGLVLAGAIAFMGIITAEVLYPDYSTRQDISDLGSTLPRIRSSTNHPRASSTVRCW